MSVNACRRSTSFLDFPCPRCAPGRWSSVGYEAGRRSGHGAKVPGAPSVRRRGGPAFVPHQAPLTPHIASHGSVSCRCSSSSSTSYGVWVPTGSPPRRCWSPCARCARHGRNRTSKRGSRTSRGQPFGGVGGFQVPARCAGPSPVSAAAHAVASCIRCSVVGSPCRARCSTRRRSPGCRWCRTRPTARRRPGRGVPWLARGSAGASLLTQRSQVQILPRYRESAGQGRFSGRPGSRP